MSIFAELEALNVLVVGANRGIGLGFVQQLLGEQQIKHLYATYRQTLTAQLQNLAEQHDQLHLLPMDITDEGSIEQAVTAMRQQINRLHWVIYCVGFLHADGIQPEKSLQQIQPEVLLRYFEVNSIGAILLAKHLLPLLKHGDRSVFASISAKVGSIGDNQLGGWYGYRASKSALNMFMHTAAIEYSRKAPKAILVMLHPGTTDTQLSKPFQRNVPPEQLFPVERTVTQLLSVMEKLQPQDSGQFFNWDGSRLPW